MIAKKTAVDMLQFREFSKSWSGPDPNQLELPGSKR